MTQSSSFNVGGRLVENHLDGHDELPDGKMPRISTKRNPILFDEAVGQGVAALNFVVTRESDGYSSQRVARAVGRARRVFAHSTHQSPAFKNPARSNQNPGLSISRRLHFDSPTCRHYYSNAVQGCNTMT